MESHKSPSPGAELSMSEERVGPAPRSQPVVEPERSADEVPSRPSSRLGFNEVSGEPDAPNADTETVQRFFSPSQSVGVRERTLSAPTMAGITAPALHILPPASEAEKSAVPSPPAVEGVVHPPTSLSTAQATRSLAAPKKSPTSVSRLCFPFVTTSSARRKKPAPPPPPRHKHSCAPTKLSPFEARKPSPVHQRHNYPQHGYSRLALEHTKWFWSMREGEGAKPPVSIQEAVPDAITSKPAAAPRLLPPDEKTSQDIPAPMSIHPRRGDIAALRDPYCVEVDHSFVGLYTWTIAKTLWMHDVHLAVEKHRPRLQILLDEDVSDAESEYSLDTSRSTSFSCFSDDSETTLVEIDNDSDASFDHERMIKKRQHLDLEDTDDMGGSSSATTPAASAPPSPLPVHLELDMAKWATIPYKMLGSRPLQHPKPSWATNWYHRWEILKGLARKDLERRQRLSADVLLLAPAIRGSPSLRKLTVQQRS